SLHHGTNEHAAGMHWMLTGSFAPLTDQAGGTTTHPSLGSVVARLRGPNRPGMVPYVHIAPDPMGFPIFLRIHEAAYLGSRYNPLMVESARARADQNSVLEHLIAKPEFHVPNLELLPGIDVTRLDDREQLRQRFDALNRRLQDDSVMGRIDQFQ